MEICCRVYRPRDPRKTPLFGLLDSLYDRVKGAWEERFEPSDGFWRGLVDEVVARYLDGGIWLMRRILVDHARARAAAKRGGGLRVTLAEAPELGLVLPCAPFGGGLKSVA